MHSFACAMRCWRNSAKHSIPMRCGRLRNYGGRWRNALKRAPPLRLLRRQRGISCVYAALPKRSALTLEVAWWRKRRGRGKEVWGKWEGMGIRGGQECGAGGRRGADAGDAGTAWRGRKEGPCKRLGGTHARAGRRLGVSHRALTHARYYFSGEMWQGTFQFSPHGGTLLRPPRWKPRGDQGQASTRSELRRDHTRVPTERHIRGAE